MIALRKKTFLFYIMLFFT